jgi:hypothetical protein
MISFLPRYMNFEWRVWKETKNSAGRGPPPDSDPFVYAESGENYII